MSRWDAKDVSTWITRCLKLPYGPLFEAARVDGYALIELTNEDLQRLGVVDPKHIKQLEEYISIFRSLLGRKEQAQVEANSVVDAAARAAPTPTWAAPAPRGLSDEQRSHSPARSRNAGRVSPTRRRERPSTSGRLSPSNLMDGAKGAEVRRPTPVTARVPMSLTARDVRGSSLAAPPSATSSDAFPSSLPKGEATLLFSPPPVAAAGKAGGGSLRQSASCESVSTCAATQNTLFCGLSRTPSQRSFRGGKDNKECPYDTTFDPRYMPAATFARAKTNRNKVESASPGHYCGPGSTLRLSGTGAGGVIPRAPRITADPALSRGAASPGVGRYSPPPRRPPPVGGTFHREKRFQPASEPQPGPQSYRPQTSFLSTSK